MGNDRFANMFDLMIRRVSATASFNHLFTTALLAQRDAVLKTVRTSTRYQHTDFPFLPVLWSANPTWNAPLMVAAILRDHALFRELMKMSASVETPTQPYFLFGVREGLPSQRPRRSAHRLTRIASCQKGLTAYEVASLVFFSSTLLRRPELMYAACEARRPADASIPIFAYIEDPTAMETRYTFEPPPRHRVLAIPTALHRQCFPPLVPARP